MNNELKGRVDAINASRLDMANRLREYEAELEKRKDANQKLEQALAEYKQLASLLRQRHQKQVLVIYQALLQIKSEYGRFRNDTLR